MGTFIAITIRVLKLAFLFWPFFINIVFGGRPVREVLRANKSFTILFMLLLTVAFTLVVTTITLTSLRSNYATLTSKHKDARIELNAIRLQNQRFTERLNQCTPNDYDTNGILNRLNNYRSD